MTIYTTRRLFGKLILQENGKDAKEAPSEFVDKKEFERIMRLYLSARGPIIHYPPTTGGARPDSVAPAQATGVDMPVGRPKV